MDTICQELGIPRKQIKSTKVVDRYLIAVHKSWLQCLLVQKKLAEFPIYLGADEWPAGGKYSSHAWTNVYISVKHNTIYNFLEIVFTLTELCFCICRLTKNTIIKYYHCHTVKMNL